MWEWGWAGQGKIIVEKGDNCNLTRIKFLKKKCMFPSKYKGP